MIEDIESIESNGEFNMTLMLKDLEGLMSKTQALVFMKLKYCLENNLHTRKIEGLTYVCRKPREWVDMIEVRFQNGRISHPAVCTVFRAMAYLEEHGYIISRKVRNVSCFTINMKALEKIIEDFNDNPPSERVACDSNESGMRVECDSNASGMRVECDSNASGMRLACDSNATEEPLPHKAAGDLSTGPTNTNTITNTHIEESEVVKVWEEEFPERPKPSRFDFEAFSNAKMSLTELKEHLRRAKTSKFILDKPHLQTLHWLLKPETVQNIKDGAYGVEKVITSKDPRLAAALIPKKKFKGDEANVLHQGLLFETMHQKYPEEMLIRGYLEGAHMSEMLQLC